MENTLAPTRRAALYIRVSTDEQVRKGYSLPAQKEDLETYAKQNGYAVVDCYVDDGVSARKRYTARKELMRLLEDVKAGKIDVILFIKLDRWFRSVADYYEIQKILDAHHVVWKATREEYDTETTNGKFALNILLAVAQDMSDRTSDRIKFVFENKVAHGQVIAGNIPLGLKREENRLVHDPEKVEIARALFRRYQESRSSLTALRYLEDTYGIAMSVPNVYHMLRNPLYKGQYRDNLRYCEPIIPPDEFDRIQELLKSRAARHNQTGRVYVFSGLLVCTECGKKMTGVNRSYKGQEKSIIVA